MRGSTVGTSEISICSNQKSTITDDDGNFYKLDKFEYFIKKKLLKGDNIVVVVDYKNPNDEEKDIYEFKDGIFNLENKDYVASDTKINVKKNIIENIVSDKINKLKLQASIPGFRIGKVPKSFLKETNVLLIF